MAWSPPLGMTLTWGCRLGDYYWAGNPRRGPLQPAASARVAMHCGARAAGRVGVGAGSGEGGAARLGGRGAGTGEGSVFGFWSLEFSFGPKVDARFFLVPEWEVARCLFKDQSREETRDAGLGSVVPRLGLGSKTFSLVRLRFAFEKVSVGLEWTWRGESWLYSGGEIQRH